MLIVLGMSFIGRSPYISEPFFCILPIDAVVVGLFVLIPSLRLSLSYLSLIIVLLTGSYFNSQNYYAKTHGKNQIIFYNDIS